MYLESLFIPLLLPYNISFTLLPAETHVIIRKLFFWWKQNIDSVFQLKRKKTYKHILDIFVTVFARLFDVRINKNDANKELPLHQDRGIPRVSNERNVSPTIDKKKNKKVKKHGWCKLVVRVNFGRMVQYKYII